MLNFFKNLFSSGPDAAGEAIKNGALVIDVRSPQEFAAGHLEGSENIPLDQVKEKIEAIRKHKKPVVTVCRSGSRSAVAQNILKAGGVEAYNGGSWFSHTSRRKQRPNKFNL